MTDTESRPPSPPFTLHSAVAKVRAAENGWNGRDPAKVAKAYTQGSEWRNRDQIFSGRDAITAFLAEKWQREHEYRLIKELWAHDGNRIAVRFAYEWHDERGQWVRSYGNENWQFDAGGLMMARHASINDLLIDASERLFHWNRDGIRPLDHPELSELNL